MARIRKPSDIKVGHWYYFCCELDLYQIKDEQELDDVRSTPLDFDEDSPFYHRVFETREEALADIDQPVV